ncbi:hypothetical protein [Amycolatopsis sp. DG1A-15b]|uniref:hypothetical protein n=1 Tax=Amycolatopsis sp. DG1A-15b TaxID=3052846 RepID=UPI00255BDDF6|nr:hypothetical protein [Amycolatopsis sp. DG1A-15b]WIX89246.1 hypothetical protein QRY02_02000 [Amycolatopsis sp. DG1A-15b]
MSTTTAGEVIDYDVIENDITADTGLLHAPDPTTATPRMHPELLRRLDNRASGRGEPA